jgi:alpha-glucoside transport system permease protein
MGQKQGKLISAIIVNGLLLFLCLAWTVPTLGLLVSSLRPRDEVLSTGWWNTNPTSFTLANYEQVLSGKEFPNPARPGGVERGDDMSQAFLNSITVTVPSTLIPILIAAFAAYAFAWMTFPGRKFFFTVVVALLVVPLQIALIPLLRDYTALGLNGTYLSVWLAHTGFGLPLATYLLFNYISQLPRDILESAFIDGASHFTIFFRLILPLSMPALASFAIFQFLWVWNDLLVALVFLGSGADVSVLTQRLTDMSGSRGQDWHLLTAGAFVTMAIPLLVFFSLQRYFVRGLLAGSVKG